jgi:hypothetical protein
MNKTDKGRSLLLESRELHRKPEFLAFATSLWIFDANRAQAYLLCALALDESWSVKVECRTWWIVNSTWVLNFE